MASAKNEKMKTETRFGLEGAHLVSLVGIVSAIVLAVVANILVARHYKRWDWTKSKRYTLSAATLSTLHDLQEPVDLWLLMGGADPLEQSVKQTLVAYQAETDKLHVHLIDPDRDTAALEDVRKRFKIDTGRTEDGHVVTDAVMVASKGDKHWFVGANDLVSVAPGEGEEGRAQPREEQAITLAIRNVLGGDKSKLCFTAGHGELELADGSEEGLSFLADILQKDNYETATVDTSAADAHDPFKGCAVVLIAGARGPFTKEESNRLRTYLMDGGSLYLAVSPLNAQSESGMVPAGLDDALSPFGIALDDDLVFEVDPKVALPDSRGIRFFATAKEHPVTAGLVHDDAVPREVPRVMINFARSLHHVSPPGASSAVDLLASSDKSYGVVSIAGAADWTDIPDKKPRDLSGPLVLAMAGERPKLAPSMPHGPRVVVVGSGSAVIRRNWAEPLPLRGAALFTESAISWLASKPAILDVQAKASVAAGIRITEDSRAEVKRYVLVFMPLAALLLGLAVGLRRRGTEGAPRGKSVKQKERQKGHA
ncbi:MAG: Gldg family protein [Polyangiaceae bacterium]